MVKTQQAAVGMWSTCKVVQHVHSSIRHRGGLGGFLMRLCGAAPGGNGQPAGLSMTPSTAAFRGVWVLMRNYELRPLGGRAGGAPGQLADGRQRGGQARAARPCWRRSRRACLSFNNLHEHLFRGETAFGVGFRAAYGSTRFNSLPGFCKPGSVPPAAPRVSIFCRQNHR